MKLSINNSVSTSVWCWPITCSYERHDILDPHLNNAEKVNSSYEHVFHLWPRTLLESTNASEHFSNSIKRSAHDAGQVAKRSFCRRERQAFRQAGECDYTPESLWAEACESGLYKRHYGYKVGRWSSQRPYITLRQIHWAKRRFNPINFHREGRLITFGSP